MTLVPRNVQQIDWDNWIPQVRANLCFIQSGGKVLLIRKLRGFGMGKINGPGGKIEPGESMMESAIRETIEEVGVEPLNPVKRGELFFQFLDSLSIHCSVFWTAHYTGTPIITDEAIPMWFDLDKVPYDEMWKDDVHWLPQVLNGHSVTGKFIFDGEALIDRDVEIHTP